MLGASNTNPVTLTILTDRAKYRMLTLFEGNYDSAMVRTFVSGTKDKRVPVLFISGVRVLKRLINANLKDCAASKLVVLDEPDRLEKTGADIVDAERKKDGSWQNIRIGESFNKRIDNTPNGVSSIIESLLKRRKPKNHQTNGGSSMAKKSWIQKLVTRAAKGIDDDDKIEILAAAIYEFVCGARSQRSFMSAMKSAAKAGADLAKLERIKENELEGDKGSRVFDAYCDHAVLGTKLAKASKESDADTDSVAFLVKEGYVPYAGMKFVEPLSYELLVLRCEASGPAIPAKLLGEEPEEEEEEEYEDDEGEEEEEEEPEDEGGEEEEEEEDIDFDEDDEEEEDEDGDEDEDPDFEEEDLDEDDEDDEGEEDDEDGDEDEDEDDDGDEDEEEDGGEDEDEDLDFDDEDDLDFGDDEDEDDEPPKPPPKPVVNKRRGKKTAKKKKTTKKKKTAKKKTNKKKKVANGRRKKKTVRKPAAKKKTRRSAKKTPTNGRRKKKTTKKKKTRRKAR